MTVKHIAQVKAEISSQIPDNTTGQVTPASVRLVLDDMADSFKDTIAIIDCSNNLVGLNLTVAPLILTGVWNGPTRADAGMAADATAGTVTAFSEAGYDHSFECVFTLTGVNGADIQATMYVNGVATGATDEVTLRGASNPQTLKLSSFWQAASASAVFSIRIKADRTMTAQMPRGFMKLVRKPT